MSATGMRTTAVSGPPSTTILESPKCTCCTPPQPLETPGLGQTEYMCPVTGKKYSFDPAEGLAREVTAAAVTTQNVEMEGSPRNNFFPETPADDEIRRVNPMDPFA